MKAKRTPSAISIPTKSKIRKSTGEIVNPTKADVAKYKSMYNTVIPAKRTPVQGRTITRRVKRRAQPTGTQMLQNGMKKINGY